MKLREFCSSEALWKAAMPYKGHRLAQAVKAGSAIFIANGSAAKNSRRSAGLAGLLVAGCFASI